MTMQIATKEAIFHSLTTTDQCLWHNFPRSILKRIKMQAERTARAHIRRRKENKTSTNEGLNGKNGKKIFFCGFVLQ